MKKTLGLVLILILALAPGPVFAQKLDESRIKEQIRKVLKEHPELIWKVLAEDKGALFDLVTQGNDLRRRQQWAKKLTARMNKPLKPKLTSGRIMVGGAEAPFTVVAYSDFLCSACVQGIQTLMQLMKKHPKQLRVHLKHHPSSQLARQLALYYEAAARMDPYKAWRLAELAFARSSELSRRGLEAMQEIVQELGLDPESLSRHMADPALNQIIEEDIAEAKGFKLYGKPSYVFNGVPITGAVPMEAFEELMRMWKERAAKAEVSKEQPNPKSKPAP
ncbi:MAG: DsbA family protein [Desulfarculaceae bacterium]|jgi:predicted DsbA family dithiol-disulfide isomerase